MSLGERYKEKRARRRAEQQRRIEINRGLEEIVDAVDPRLRSLSGYKRRLEPAGLRAYHHAVECVEAIPAPIEVSRDRWGPDPLLRAFFASADAMQEVFDGSAALHRFLTTGRNLEAPEIFIGMGMRMDERKHFGMELHGDAVQRDVEQTTVSFSDHIVGVAAATEEELRRQVVHRIMEELASFAMQNITDSHVQKDSLGLEQTVLRRKLQLYEQGARGMGAFRRDQGAYERRARDLRSRLAASKADLDSVLHKAGNIEDFMHLTIEVFETAAEYITVEPFSLAVDAMNVKRDAMAHGEPELVLTRIRAGKRPPRIAQFMRLSPRYVRDGRAEALREAARRMGV